MIKMNRTARVVFVLLFLSLFLLPFKPVPVVADIESGQPDVIVAEGGSRNTYFPDVEKLQNGDLIVVYYDSLAHSSPAGRIAMVRSADDGLTWSAPVTVADSVYDDRDPSIMQTSDGTLLLSYFSTDLSQTPSRAVGTFIIRSNDGGLSWSNPAMVQSQFYSVATTSKIIELDNGDLLIPLYGKLTGHYWWKAFVTRSTDGGLSWSNEVEIQNPSNASNFVEPALADLGNGHLMIMIRTGTFSQEAHSYDNGLTWTAPVQTDLEASASNLLVLDPGNPNSNILHMWGDGSDQYAFGRPVVGQIIQADGTFVSEPLIMYAGHCNDESYPSSVRLDDGRIFTVYYDSCAKTIAGTFSTVDDYMDYEAPTTYWDSETGKLDLWRMYANGNLQITTDMNYTPSYYEPHGAIDGNHSYTYSAAKVQTGEGAYWSVEMDRSYPIDKIGIVLKPGYEETANIYLSADGVNWGSPVAAFNYVVINEMEYVVLNQPVYAKYAKVEILESRGTDILAEFSLFVPPDTGTTGVMLNKVGQFEQAGQMNAVFADQLTYRLGVIGQLVSQEASTDAVAYMRDFVQTINDPSVSGQQLISETAAATLRTEADLFIQLIG
ncbi:MAG: exo-alpha-sialidase [Paenibacillus sp.]|nr:exo-alpha-sialidase [Paenibacillus sp.]